MPRRASRAMAMGVRSALVGATSTALFTSVCAQPAANDAAATKTSPAGAVSAVAPVDAADPMAPPIWPHVTLANQVVRLHVYLPDARNGYYRGSRFDWSGMVSRLAFEGHHLFAPFQSVHNPLHHDSVTGTAEELGMFSPLGYDEAAAGETFVKIGVGVLVRDSDKPYRFSGSYQLADPGQWTVTHDASSATFEHRVQGPRGWAYHYTKTLSLPDSSRPRLVITRTLRNAGAKAIDTDHYGHNFITVDDAVVIGPQYALEFPFEIKTERWKAPAEAVIDGRRLRFSGPLTGGQVVHGVLEGFQEHGAAAHQVDAHYAPANLTLRITGDHAPHRIAIYARNPALCPEFFVPVKVEPGDEMTWSNTYELLPMTAEQAP